MAITIIFVPSPSFLFFRLIPSVHPFTIIIICSIVRTSFSSSATRFPCLQTMAIGINKKWIYYTVTQKLERKQSRVQSGKPDTTHPVPRLFLPNHSPFFSRSQGVNWLAVPSFFPIPFAVHSISELLFTAQLLTRTRIS